MIVALFRLRLTLWVSDGAVFAIVDAPFWLATLASELDVAAAWPFWPKGSPIDIDVDAPCPS